MVKKKMTVHFHEIGYVEDGKLVSIGSFCKTKPITNKDLKVIGSEYNKDRAVVISHEIKQGFFEMPISEFVTRSNFKPIEKE